MSATTTERSTRKQVEGTIYGVRVKGSTKVLKGTIGVLQAGYAKGGVTGTGLIAVGRIRKTVDNTSGSDGTLSCEIEEGTFRWENSAGGDAIAIDDIGKDCFIVDNQTVALTDGSGTRSRAGVIDGVDSSGVWVQMAFGSDHGAAIDAAQAAADAAQAAADAAQADADTAQAAADAAQATADLVQSGTGTLVAGVLTVSTGITVTANTRVAFGHKVPAGTFAAGGLKCASRTVGAPGTGAITITALQADGTTETGATGTVDYILHG